MGEGGEGGGRSGRSGSARAAFMLSSGRGLRNGGPSHFGKFSGSDSYERDCFIATAVYQGENNHLNVERLRKFRDNTLSMYTWGRKFTRFYYSGFGFKLSVFMREYFPWTLIITRSLFDFVVPMLPVDLVKEEKEIPKILKMDFGKFCSSCADFLKKEARDREASCLCVGLSGGIDSAAALAICKLTGLNVAAVTVSGNEFIRQQDVNDAKEVAKHLGVEHIIVDLTGIFRKTVEFDLPVMDHILMGMRNAVIKEIAEDRDGLLVGSGVKTELYSALFSPNSILGAVFPLASVFKTQIYPMADYLGLPKCVLQKLSHSGMDGDDNDSFWGLGYAMFDWVSALVEQGLSAENIERETGVLCRVVNAIKEQKDKSDRNLSFPNFKP